MVKRKAIIRKLPAVETLGCATIICSDKTGTLTQNQMTVRQVYCEGKTVTVTGNGYDPKGDFIGEADFREKSVFHALFRGAVLCNNAFLSRKGIKVAGIFRGRNKSTAWGIEGDPTEGALLVAGAKAGIWRETIERKEERVGEIPFDSERKMMSVIYKNKEGLKAYVKGAPDSILRLCTAELTREGVIELTPQRIKEIIKANDAMAGQALRVLAVAERKLTDLQEESVEKELVFVGLLGMIDPPRPSAVKAIKICRQAGIKPVMITGDHKLTAQAVARELGMIKGRNQRVVTGQELDKMSEEELGRIILDISVFARVAPKDKLRIVTALKKKGEIVAMTGDGVNDAPAVKEADIGVAMGIAGTDVTKEASSMIISDDNFAAIVAAVEEGRGIYDNIRKFIRYLLSCNLGEVLTMFIGTLVGLPLPLLPIQILWVNLVTDGLPAMALGVDRAEPDIMRRPPRRTDESVFARGLGRKIVINGTMIGFGTLFVFIFGLWSGCGLPTARTMAFTTLVMAQLFQVFDCKSETKGIFEINIFSNLFLIAAVLISSLMQLAVIYLPLMQEIFQTTALNSWQWLIVLLAAGGPTMVLGVLRLVRNVVYSREQYV